MKGVWIKNIHLNRVFLFIHTRQTYTLALVYALSIKKISGHFRSFAIQLSLVKVNDLQIICMI